MISNFYPVRLQNPDFRIGRVPYDDKRQRSLKATYNSDNSFFRHGEHTYVSPMGATSVPDLENVTLNAFEDHRVVGSLLRHIFFRTFRDAFGAIIPISFSPFQILSRQSKHDLIAQALSKIRVDPADLDGRVGRKKLVSIGARHVGEGTDRVFGFVLNVRYNWTFGAGVNCATLIADGLNLKGREVLLVEPIPGLSGVLAPTESLIGVVKFVNGTSAVVETNDGDQTVALAQLLPRRNRRNVDDILGLYIGEHRVGKLWREVKALDTSRLSAKAYFREVNDVAKTISELSYCNNDGFAFNISPKPFQPGSGFKFEDPIFRFDYNPGASNMNASTGLVLHGPYDKVTFEPKTPRVAILCHSTARDAFTSFLGKLRSGIPEARFFKTGMLGKYHLQNLSYKANVDFIETPGFSADDYEKCAADYLAQTDADSRADIVFVQTREDFKTRSSGQNPYYRAKSRFMVAGVPTQFLKTETIRKPDGQLQYTIDSIALQVYAKLGGVPYVLPAGNNVDREIVVGIGHSISRSNSFAGNDQDHVVGITTFFKADGQYLYGTRCEEVPYEKYFDALLKNLRKSIEMVASDYGWRDGDSVRLVFHIFKPIKDIEAEVVAKVVEEYPQYNVTYAFVTISERHPFVIFDPSEQGKWDRRLGEYVPPRRTNWVLNDHSCLIQLVGAQQMSTAAHGFSSPILVRVHEHSTYRDLHAIAQQVFNFSFMSWRSFKSSRKPVTVDYAGMIADKLAHLRRVEGWLPEAVNAPAMKKKKWFL